MLSDLKNGIYKTDKNQKRAFWDIVTSPINLYFYGYLYCSLFKGFLKARKGIWSTKYWSSLSRTLVGNFERSGAKISITGLDIVERQEEAVVYIGNHMSSFETFLLPYFLTDEGAKEFTFVVKESLATYPLFGHLIRASGPITVGRKSALQDFTKVIKEGTKKIKNGQSIGIFPQRTRAPKFIPAEFNTLGVKLAKAAGAKVIPIALKTDFWEKGKILSDFGKINREKNVHFAFGEPIEVTAKNEKQVHKQVIQFIEKHLQKWEEEDQVKVE